jgi:hypothetical protein
MTPTEIEYVEKLKELIKTQRSIIYFLQETSKRKNWRLLLQDLYIKRSALRKEINNFSNNENENTH